MSKQRGRALGRGLESLFPPAAGAESQGSGLPQYIDVDQVRPSPWQAREPVSEESLQDLAESIQTHGVLQPVLVRRLRDGYELIAGERRWRAAVLAGIARIPAIVRQDAEGEDGLLLGLLENLQRSELDPVEAARGIRRLIDQFGLTHEEAGARLGMHRVAVSQAMRLLNACPAVLAATKTGRISAGHARALVGLGSAVAQELALQLVLDLQLSVRDTERWVREHGVMAVPRTRTS